MTCTPVTWSPNDNLYAQCHCPASTWALRTRAACACTDRGCCPRALGCQLVPHAGVMVAPAWIVLVRMPVSTVLALAAMGKAIRFPASAGDCGCRGARMRLPSSARRYSSPLWWLS